MQTDERKMQSENRVGQARAARAKAISKIAVTGGAGAIGSRVCDELMEAGHEVLCLDTRAPSFDVPHREVDLLELDAACEAVEGADQVVHLAAIPNPFMGDPPERVIGN